jgi:DNA-binding MarR family transcriptional regulator
VLAAHDLTHLQFQTLAMAAWLVQSGEAVPQSALARSGDIHPMQLSNMLKALESKGLVARARSPQDERAKRVEVTPAGVTSLRRALPVVIDVQRRLFGQDGSPGGSLLSALLRLDGEHAEASRPPASPAAASSAGQPSLQPPRPTHGSAATRQQRRCQQARAFTDPDRCCCFCRSGTMLGCQ